MSLVLRRSRIQGYPELSLLKFQLNGLVAEARRDFPTLACRRIEVWLQTQSTLACIVDEGESACIRLHSVLNHPETPRRVIAFILCHELIHLLVPPRDVDGKRKSHPPEFWETEHRLSPDRASAWGWLILVLGACLQSNRRKECTFVKRNWNCLMNGERPTLEQLASLLGPRMPSPEGTLL
jgi:hypothetical protein